MSIFDLFSRNTKRSLENPQYDWPDWIPPSNNGVVVTRESCLGLPAVFRGCRLVASSIARLPCDIYERLENGGREKAKEHPAYNVLRWQPHRNYHAISFYESLIVSALLAGNGYAKINRNSFGDVESLELLDPTKVLPYRADGVTFYMVSNVGTFTSENILHVHNIAGGDGLVGYSVIQLLNDSFSLAIHESKFAVKFFSSNCKPNLSITLPSHIRDEETIKDFRRMIKAVHTANPYEPLIPPPGSVVQEFSINNSDNELVAQRQYSLIEVANAIGVPASFLGSTQNTSYGSLEAERQALLTYSLEPWLSQLEIELRQKVLRETEKANDSFYVEFNRSALERSDKRTETDTMVSQVNAGILQVDEAREKLNLPPKAENDKPTIDPEPVEKTQNSVEENP